MERSLTHVALFAALIAVLGLVPQISLASGVPITAQSLGIMLCGTVLGARRGALAVILFLALVAAGLPPLSGRRGGVGGFSRPPGGHLGGFPVASRRPLCIWHHGAFHHAGQVPARGGASGHGLSARRYPEGGAGGHGDARTGPYAPRFAPVTGLRLPAAVRCRYPRRRQWRQGPALPPDRGTTAPPGLHPRRPPDAPAPIPRRPG